MKAEIYSIIALTTLSGCQSTEIGDKLAGSTSVGTSISEVDQAVTVSSPIRFVVLEPKDLKWQDVPGGLGAQFAILKGNPSESGIYVMRVRFPPFVMDREHLHTGDRYVTVIEGEWFAGIASKFDPAAARRVVAGGYMYHPANGVHWDGSASAAGAVVQIIGLGPVKTNQLHSSQSDWVDIRK